MRTVPDMNMRTIMCMPSGSGVLSKFIDRYLNHILTRSSKQGSDVVYSINTTASGKSSEASPSLWQTFVQPNTNTAIIIRNSNLELIDNVGLKTDQNEKIILSVTDSELQEIQTNFMDANNISDRLPNISETYYKWTSGLKKIEGSYYKKWIQFRLEKLEYLFKTRLESLMIEPDLSKELIEIMRVSKLAAKPTVVEKNNINKPYTEKNSSNLKLEQIFQSAIIEVIQNLPLSELREIKLPCGVVFDAIINQNNKS